MHALPDKPDEFSPATPSELSRWMAENAADARRPIYPAGGRTARHVGKSIAAPGITVSTTELNRVIDYPARDMTVTVEAGIRMEELARVLAAERQRLAIDVPQPRRATLGGVLATNTSGSRRFGLGTMRDYVIGLSAIDAAGRQFKSGGRVVKNVAGYDLCKLLVGSYGTLAIVTQVTLKLKPLPEQSRLLWASFDHLDSIEQALAKLLTSAARPVAVDVLDARGADAVLLEAGLRLPSNRYVLCLGVEGTEKESNWQISTLQAEIQPFGPMDVQLVPPDDADVLWQGLVEYQASSDDPVSFKANLPPSATVEFLRQAQAAGCGVLAHAGSGIVYGHIPDTITSAQAAEERLAPLRQFARKGRGNLVITACEESWKPHLPLGGAPEQSWPLMRQLKARLDPGNLLNPQHQFDGN